MLGLVFAFAVKLLGPGLAFIGGLWCREIIRWTQRKPRSTVRHLQAYLSHFTVDEENPSRLPVQSLPPWRKCSIKVELTETPLAHGKPRWSIDKSGEPMEDEPAAMEVGR